MSLTKKALLWLTSIIIALGIAINARAVSLPDEQLHYKVTYKWGLIHKQAGTVNNYFARIPTRGILITTRGKSLIQDNIFYRIPMPSILVSDDARGWYESGPVKDLTIRRNTFIECSSPVIAIMPEIDRYDRPVHENIVIDGNRFIMDGYPAVEAKAASNLQIINKIIMVDKPEGEQKDNYVLRGNHISNTKIDNNTVIGK